MRRAITAFAVLNSTEQSLASRGITRAIRSAL